ncbi:MAG TPA: TfoX/Sxy family protein, partial [Casimicrobiaceae bacterium]|nr:TfoX/Sxy family protein [Casimicrobiaceae bacterium]
MRNSPHFIAYVLELMQGGGAATARPMFGGHGIYVDGHIVGIVVADTLYLKTNDETRPAFLAHGLASFRYEKKSGPIEGTSYYEPPEEALESRDAMREWLRLALSAALRAPSRK